MALVVPPEICGLICQEQILSRYDLRILCSLTRSFRSEAERLLYASVTLRGLWRITAFCVTLAQLPHLALHIKQLTLHMPPQAELQAEDLSRIMHALHLSANLKDLSILGYPGTTSDSAVPVDDEPGKALHPWILEGHNFQLDKFTNSYFHPPLLVDLLKQQSSIHTLSLKSKGKAEICDAPLPYLVNLDISAAVVQEFSTPSWHRRRIQRLHFDCQNSTDAEELATFVALTQFQDTLKSLSICRQDGEQGLDIAVLTACAAAQLPDIKYLKIMDYTKKHGTYHVPFLPFPLRFTQIDTLIFRPPTKAYDGIPRDALTSSYLELRTPEGRRGAATRIMKDLPTLTRLVLIGIRAHEFTRDLVSGKISDSEVDLETLDHDDWLHVG